VTSRLDDRALLARLVGFNTVSRLSNLELIDFLSDYLERPEVKILRNPSADGTKANLVVLAGPDDSDRGGLALSGHMDVVPAEESDWRSDPFTMLDVGQRYIGRGTADMKGFLALAVNRLVALDPAKLRRPLGLVFTYDEEVGTLGARRLVQSCEYLDQLPRHVVIGEPTELRVVRAHKGMLRLKLSFSGQAAHSGYPQLGRNAIEPAGTAVVALARLRKTMEAERQPNAELFPEVPCIALNVGTIAGGVAANIIPDRCEIQLGIRLLPGTSAESITERVLAAVQAEVAESIAVETISESPAMMLPNDSSLLRLLCEVAGEREPATVMFASDAGWLQRGGFECVLFGPGSIQVAHQANESMPVNQFRRAGEILDRLIHRSCVAA
jgi:acetylornithine deacetylase